MPHAIWTGVVSFGLVTIPVRLHSAGESRDLAFHMLDRRDLARVRQKRVNEVTGEEVPWEEIVKGYEAEKGGWVVVTDEDFRAADVVATQTIDILGFVEAGSIGPEWFDRPYHLEPLTPGRKAYALLRDTLAATGRVGVAKVVVRTRQHLAALVPEGDLLLLVMLRWDHELRGLEDLDLPSSGEAQVTTAEREMAETLVASMATEWEPAAYADTYRDSLLALIERKAKEGEVAAPPPPPDLEGGEVVDIMELLRESVRRAGGAGG